MAKTLKDFLEGYLKVKSADEQKFVDKHVTAKNPDRNGKGDDVFGASKVKTIDRRQERKGYNPGEDEQVYEAVETERVKHPVGQRPKGPGWVLKSAGEQTGKDHNVWERKFKRVGTTNEELKGGQKKIDKNHNGKLDAHDFLLLRKKKKVAEEAEQIDELSRQTTSSYFNKAMNNRSAANRAGNTALAAKRTAGMATANDKMNPSGKSKIAAAGTIREEEVEQIAELSTGTLQSYRKKARAQGNKIIDNMKVGGGDWSKDQVNTKTLRKRAAGAQASGKQLVKRGESLKTEEADQIDESAKIAAHLIKRYGDNVSKSHVRSAANDFGVDASKLAKAVRAKLGKNTLGEEAEQIDEAGYSAKAARAGKDLGKPGKNFSKIASAAAKKYGSKAAGGRVAGAILAKLRKEEKLAELIADLSESHQRTMTNVFEKLNEDNKSKFLEACDTPDGVEQMLDFAINHRGE